MGEKLSSTEDNKEDKAYGLTGGAPEEENQGKKIEQIWRTIIEKTFWEGEKSPETLYWKNIPST